MGMGRLQHVILGTIAGFLSWVMTDLVPDHGDGRLTLTATVLVLGFFGPALAMAGELRLRGALMAAAIIALPLTILMVVDSLGFSTVAAFLESGHSVFAALLIGTLPIPFLIAIGQKGRQAWSDYPALFMNSWNVVVRYATALLFVGVVWLVLLLSSELLQLVGIDTLAEVLREEAVIWTLSGAVLGLGLSVVTDLSDLISPYLLLRLLRLLLPVVLVVVAVFVAALPLRGLDRLFGHLSATGILISVAAAAVALISITVDQDDVEAAHDRLLPLSARLLALFLPVLAGLSAWALVLRVEQYGWTPARVSALASVAVVSGYAVSYTVAVFTGRNWTGFIRGANLTMALALIALAVLWLTPLISPERIAVRSQMARFDAGIVHPDQLPLWEMAHEWGHEGESAVADLRERAKGAGQEDLAARLVLLDNADSRWQMQSENGTAANSELIAQAQATFLVAPQGRELPDGIFDRVDRLILRQWMLACDRPTRAGNAGCLVLLADLLPDPVGEEAVVVLNRAQSQVFLGSPVLLHMADGWQQSSYTQALDRETILEGDLIDLIVKDGFNLVPSGINAVQVDGHRFTVAP